MTKRLASWWRNSAAHEFQHVHLPDDGQVFLKPRVRTLGSELVDASGRKALALACFRKGDQLLTDNRHTEAADEYRRSFAASPSLSAQLACGVALMIVSRLGEAAEAFDEVLSMKADQKRLKAASMINLGQAYGDLGRPESTNRVLEKAIEVSRAAGVTSLTAMSHLRLAFMLFQHGVPVEGMARCDEAARLCRSMCDTSGLASVLCAKGLILRHIGDTGQADRALRDGIALARSLRRSYPAARACMQLAHLRALQGKEKEATDLIGAVSKLPDNRRRARCQGILAVIYLNDGRAQEALEAVQAAMRLDRRMGYGRGVARDGLICGQICLQQGLVPEACRALSEASRIAGEIGHAALGIETTALLAAIRTDLPDSERVSTLATCISKCRTVRRPGIEVNVQSVLGRLWMAAGRLAEARSSCELALEQSRALSSPLDEANCCAMLGHLRELEGQPEQALELTARGQAILQRMGLVLR